MRCRGDRGVGKGSAEQFEAQGMKGGGWVVIAAAHSEVLHDQFRICLWEGPWHSGGMSAEVGGLLVSLLSPCGGVWKEPDRPS